MRMAKHPTATALALAGLLLCAAHARAQLSAQAASVPAGTVPAGINYQGRLMDNGFPVTGTRSVSFRLYDAATGGALLWSSGAQSVVATQGVFGATLSISTGPLSGPARKYLEVQVDNTTLSPREPLNAVPYALVAKSLEDQVTIASVTVGSQLISSGTLSVTTIAALPGTAGVRVSTSVTVEGSLGLGTAAPGYRLDVQGGQINASGGLCIAGVCQTGWAGVSGVTGAGTAGYMTKWTGGATIGNSALVEGTAGLTVTAGSTLTVTGAEFSVGGSTLVVANGNVGIGTTNPLQKLEVIGGIKSSLAASGNQGGITLGTEASERPKIEFNVSDNSRRFWFGVNDVGLASERLSLYAGPLGGNATTESVVFRGNGNVGIGTTSPASKLHILDGDIRVSTSAGQPSKGIVFQDGSVQTTAAGGTGGGWTDTGSVVQLLTPTDTIGSTGAGVTVSTHLIVSAGNVGIGMVGPNATLHVSSAATAATTPILIVSSGTAAGQELLRVQKDGNVGIGTANPTMGALQVSGPGTAKIVLEHTSGADLELHNNDGAGLPGLHTNPPGTPLSLQEAGNVVLARASGNVGIGTTSPASKLHVLDGDIRVSTSAGQPSKGIVFQDGSVQTTAAGGTGGGWTDTGSVVQLVAPTDTIGSTGAGVTVSTHLIVSAGNVGIGTTSPSERLEVNGALKIAGIKLLQDSGDANRLFLQPATPNQSLNISVAPNGASGTPGIELFKTDGNADRVNIESLRLLANQGTNRYEIRTAALGTGSIRDLAFLQGAAEVMTLATTGNVGIGTTAPASKLDVRDGDIRISTTTGSKGIVFQDGSVQSFSGKVINVTFRVSSTRVVLGTSASIVMESFSVDKKSATSTLLIQGSLAGFGDYSGSMNQGWKLGTGMEVLGQGIMYSASSSIHGRVFPTAAVITGHTTTGLQTMVFRYFTQDSATGNRPFVVYNPNSTDDTRLGQTQSVYTVWEIEP